MINRIEKLPRTSDAHVFIASMTDGTKERVMLWPNDAATEEQTLAAARAEIERRVVARGR